VKTFADQHVIEAVVAADHPALPGHFPGQPIVPGVILLAMVHDHARQQLGFTSAASTWTRIRFMRPVLPDQRFNIALQGGFERFTFTISSVIGERIAAGQCRGNALA
jgi:3-hydroxyacyl-[acyl-carrier-protein] dehydratase